jgi:hypothetical protein
MSKILGLEVMTHDRQASQNTCVELRNKTNPSDVFMFIPPVKCSPVEIIFIRAGNKLPGLKVDIGDKFVKELPSLFL